MKVEFDGRLIGLSPPVTCQDLNVDVDFEALLKVDINNPAVLDELAANPVLSE